MRLEISLCLCFCLLFLGLLAISFRLSEINHTLNAIRADLVKIEGGAK